MEFPCWAVVLLRVAGPGRFMTWTCDAIGRLMSIGTGRFMIATEDTVVGADEISEERL